MDKLVDKVLELTHTEMVRNLIKPGSLILDTLTPSRCNIMHIGMGIVGESGELLDAIKKYIIYDKELDIDNITEELGDIEFFLTGLRDALNITREATLKHNINKLLTGKNARYREGRFSNQQAQMRADKQ